MSSAMQTGYASIIPGYSYGNGHASRVLLYPPGNYGNDMLSLRVAYRVTEYHSSHDLSSELLRLQFSTLMPYAYHRNSCLVW